MPSGGALTISARNEHVAETYDDLTPGDYIRITVTDTGAWKTPRDSAGSHRGRGISLMRHLMQDLSIQSSGAGTTVHMYARIT